MKLDKIHIEREKRDPTSQSDHKKPVRREETRNFYSHSQNIKHKVMT